MLQAFIMKRIAGAIIKKVMEKRELKKMKKYVEEEKCINKTNIVYHM